MNSGPATRARVLLLIPHLGIGGAQHVVATLACHVDPKKYEVHLALLTQPACADLKFPESVRMYCLGAKRARYSLLSFFALVWRLRPDLILVGMAHLAPLLLIRPLLPPKTRFIVRQNGSVSSLLAAMPLGTLGRVLLSFAYRRADTIICQTQSTAEELQRKFRLDRIRICVLSNPVNVQSCRQARSSLSPKCDPYLLAIGRLVPEKGFDLLLEALANLKPHFPSVRLLIAGSGPCQPALEFQSSLLGLASNIEFLGDVPSPSQCFRDALAYMLSSREEELPNALLEAAAAGLPIIATPASLGISALLTGRSGVWLAQDTSASALERALRTALMAISPRERFTHDWIKPFALAPAVAAFEREFDRLLNWNRE